MVKKYTKVSDQQRKELIRLIYQEKLSIKKAGIAVGIPYPNAKAVNQTYLQENRTSKKRFRFRLKNLDEGFEVPRQKILIEKVNPYEYNQSETRKRTCGFKILKEAAPTIERVTVQRDHLMFKPLMPVNLSNNFETKSDQKQLD